MTCQKCGCDNWFEHKNNMKITTSEDCSCHCHIKKELSEKETIEGMITGKIPIDGEDEQ